MINIEEQKKIAIEMWQYIKSQIAQCADMYSITSAKYKWLKENYPEVKWRNYCLLCDIYMKPNKTEKNNLEWICPNCPLTKKHKDASYGCALNEDTPWDKIVLYRENIDAAMAACDEIIDAIKEIPA